MEYLTNSKFGKTMLALTALVVALLGVTSCSTVESPPAGEGVSAIAYEEGVPGGVMVNTVDMNAKVTHIDTFNQEVTLLGSDGEKFKVKVRPDVDLDQVKVGDLVKATVIEQLVVRLAEGDEAFTDGSYAVVGLGAQAGGFVAEAHAIIGTVTMIDHEKHTVTLRFQDGSTKTFPVRNDIDLSEHKVGEQVVFHITEMIAIGIEKP